MSEQSYQDIPVKIPSLTSINTASLRGKSVLVTGGASGLGKAYVQAFLSYGAYVTIVDLDKVSGSTMVEEVENGSNVDGSRAQFQECDVTAWDQLVQAFEAAVRNSPSKGIDIVVANAGIGGKDDMFSLEDPSGPPKEPNLKIMDVNLTGVLYTTKLAFHYLRQQPNRDRCLILKSSLAGYMDLPGSVQYNTSKYAVRGLFSNLRHTSLKHGIRVNLVAPWYVQTPLLPQAIPRFLEQRNQSCALVGDCCKAILLLASEKSIHGRALGIMPHESIEEGLVDLELDDFSPESMYLGLQRIVIEMHRSFL